MPASAVSRGSTGPVRPPIHHRPGFPAHFTAPYLETWNSPDTLAEVRRNTGLSYFTLAFVVSDGGCNGAFDGTIPVDDPEWLSALRGLRTAGGDAIVSFGGAGGRELAQACDTVSALKAAYRRVVNTLGVTRIDLDIEGAALDDQQSDDRRNQALAELQQEYRLLGRPLDVDYTLPVNPWGLSDNGVWLLTNARQHGLDVDVVNVMTMDYGPDLDMGAAAIGAATGLHEQLGRLWPEKSPEQLWAMQGNTPMIGVNDAVNEVFSTEDAARLARFAAEKGIRLLAFWSVGRDRPCAAAGTLSERCSGTAQDPAHFSRILDPFPRTHSRPWTARTPDAFRKTPR
ncbi:chitinase [Kitasatospora sp. NPDC086009]|uniref:chitinase n=1 Tax=unclassified Kitasatospora TaxID=2633591 RepID=UPI0037C88D8B